MMQGKLKCISLTEALSEWSKRVDKSSKIAFIAAFVSAFFTHIYLFTRKSLNEDMLGYIQYRVDHTASGRWAEDFLTDFSSDYMVPMAIGVICFVLLALTAVITVRLLKIQNTFSVVISSVLISVFPTLAYGFGYLGMAHTYCAALFMAALSVWVTEKYKFGFLIGGVFLGLSMGAYQSYLGYAATLCIMLLVLEVFREKWDIRQLMKKIASYLGLGCVGGVSYFVGLKVCLYIKDIELLGYKGIDSMGQYTLEEIPGLLIKAWTRFWGFFTGETFFQASALLTCLYYILLGSIAVLFFVQSVQCWKQKQLRSSVCVAGVLIAALPLAINIVDLLAPESTSGTLNIYQMVLLFVFPVALLEINPEQENKKILAINNIGSWVVSGVCCVLAFSYFLTSNIYSLKLETYTKRTELLNNRIVSRIEALPGFNSNMPVAIIASGSTNPLYNSRNDFPDIVSDQGLRGQFVGYWTESHATYKFAIIVRNSMGINIKAATSEQIESIKQMPEYMQMGVWPDADSVAVIDGVAVVNCIPVVNIGVHMDEDTKSVTWSIEAEQEFLDKYTYAWYVYRNNERIEVLWYDEEQTSITIDCSTPGEYYVAAFLQALDEGERNLYKESAKITVK